MGGNRNRRGGRELSSAHPYGGMGTGRPYRLNLTTFFFNPIFTVFAICNDTMSK
jgi:hypothetical protein